MSELTALQQALLTITKLQSKLAAATRAADDAIAILGVGCRLPGGVDGPHGFRELLWEGREALSEVPAGRSALHGHLPRGGFIDGVDLFDADFFHITRREAEGIDPQQRLFLEVSWEALEHAGISPHRLGGTQTGVFAGVHAKDYAHLGTSDADKVGAHYSTGVDMSYVAGRLAYFLGLEGPAMAVDTACSSSLVAVHLACQSLLAGESKLAIAGGVKLVLSPHLSVFLAKAGALSPNGQCRAFDSAADGMVQGEGCGVVILKRLRDAERDGDRVLAIIRGSAVNHNGASGGLTVPSPRAQEALYRLALARAGVEARDIDYLEAHGTGTRLGDPIELQGLSRVYGAARTPAEPLWIGSSKSNVGHAESAAGVTGLIKAVLVLQTGEIPAAIHVNEPTPVFSWQGSGIAVARECIVLPRTGRPQRAAVSSFGMSGANAHVVLEAHHADADLQPTAVEPPFLLVLSARNEEALRQLAARYARTFGGEPDDARLYDLCFTAALGRAHHDERLAIVASTAQAFSSLLGAAAQGLEMPGTFRGRVDAEPVPVEESQDAPKGEGRLGLLMRLGGRYAVGSPVRFEDIYPGGRTATLPTYPWQRERYWWDGAETQPEAARDDAALRGLFFDLEWKEIGSLEAGGSPCENWLVVADRPEEVDGLVNALLAAGGTALVAPLAGANPEVIVRWLRELSPTASSQVGIIVWSCGDAPDTLDELRTKVHGESAAVASLVQSIASVASVAKAAAPSLYVVTRGAQTVTGREPAVAIAAAPLWGLGRVLAYEHPELRCTRIDLDPASAATPEGDVLSVIRARAMREDEVAFRDGRCFAPSLVRGNRESAPGRQVRLRADRTYLVTGGFGGIGLRLAAWLVAQGARHLALLARKEPTAVAQDELARLRAGGARIETFQVDVRSSESLAGALRVIRETLPPLGGVFHAAGVLDDGSLLRLEPSHFARVMAPKVEGTWNLHTLITEPSIDFFVLFSSTAAMIGAPGQGNYAAANAFLDAMARFRRHRGQTALSIQWGSWGEVGMAASDARRGERLADRGMLPMSVDDALAAMELALLDGTDHLAARGVAALDPEAWCRSHPTVATSSLFRRLLGERAHMPNQVPARMRDQLLAVASPERQRLLETHLKSMVSDVCGVAPARLSVTAPFVTLGIDSVMSLELRDLVTQQLEVNLPLMSFVDESTIAGLANELLQHLAAASVLATAPKARNESKRIRI
ncbi:SDR family NAD(P)-dependent oxidoreductase [Pendulispora rubella]|uniref:SDR family NAD(P)-dependent oxidoreductase n=1 Tax=Pendulispora rubella TaxID=2741070 RepID=A0ABZ2L182_9BACT